MNETQRITNLGAPVTVEVSAVEQELRRLWKAASHGEHERAVVRACSCNFVVITRDLKEAQSLLPVLARVSEWHPARSLIACRESDPRDSGDPTSPHMHAWISAQCSVPFSGGPQICSEVITVAAHRSATEDLLNTIMALLVPDLPVFIYWRSFNDDDLEPVERIARFAQLLVADSHATKDDAVSRVHLMRLLLDPPHEIAVRDLNWARLNAWRDVIAQFFDHPTLRQEAFEICEVEIERDIAAANNIPTRTLLLTGWLASRLNWHLISAERSGDCWLSRWSGRKCDIVVRFSGHVSSPNEEPGISSIALRTFGGTVFRVAREKGARYLVATAYGKGPEIVHSVPQESMDESTLLVQELSLSGKDSSFHEALKQAFALEKCYT